MAKVVEIGAYSAYAIAVKHGYQGTEEEWIQEQEANRVAAQNAADSAKTYMEGAQAAKEGVESAQRSAADSARSAEQSKNSAEAGAATATSKAAEAEGSARRAETAAGELEESVSAAAASAQAAKTSENAAKASENAAKSSAADAQAVKDSIPEDYTVLSQDVSQLKDELDAKEPLHRILSAALVTGETTLTFTDDAITDNAMVYIYTNVWGVQPSAVEQSGNVLTLTFDAQSADIGVKVEVR